MSNKFIVFVAVEYFVAGIVACQVYHEYKKANIDIQTVEDRLAETRRRLSNNLPWKD